MWQNITSYTKVQADSHLEKIKTDGGNMVPEVIKNKEPYEPFAIYKSF